MGEIIGVKIQRGNRITLPKQFLEKTKAKQGDMVGIRMDLSGKSFTVLNVKIEEK